MLNGLRMLFCDNCIRLVMRVLTYSSVRPCVSEISAQSGLSVIGRAADDVTAALALSPGSGPTHALQSGHNSTLHTGHAAQPAGYTQSEHAHSHRFCALKGTAHTKHQVHVVLMFLILCSSTEHNIRCFVKVSCTYNATK